MKPRPSTNGTAAPPPLPLPMAPSTPREATPLEVPIEELTDADIKMLARQAGDRVELNLRQERERLLALRAKAKKT